MKRPGKRNIFLDKLVGRCVRDARVQLGWSRQRLAETFGCSPQKFRNIETGRVGISVSDLVRVAEVLRVPPLFLLRDVIDLNQIDAVREMMVTQHKWIEAELTVLRAKLANIDNALGVCADVETSI